MEKVKRENIGEFLFEIELEIIGATRLSIVDFDNWRTRFPMTKSQYSEFRDYSIKLMMKTFRCNKNKAIDTFNWYWMQFGVKITSRS
jgi:hypothetical protein